VSPSILITGASKGLGFRLTESFLRGGWTVFAGHREPSPGLEAAAASMPGRLFTLALDVISPPSIAAAVASVTSATETLDVLINNAAILPAAGRGLIEEMNVEVGLEVYDVNALGPLRVTQAFLPLLKRGSRKLILNVSSEAGSIGDCWRKDEFLYCMSKAALNMQTAILKNHLTPQGFQLLAVHPGWMRTDMGGANADIDPAQAADALLKLTMSPRRDGEVFFLDSTGKEMNW
jgi:NAD(P)-dependent dehydrogenase (short-subunit alcohol dehydrogenase family)